MAEDLAGVCGDDADVSVVDVEGDCDVGVARPMLMWLRRNLQQTQGECIELVEPADLGCFTHIGIDPLSRKYSLTESRQEFRAAFEPIACSSCRDRDCPPRPDVAIALLAGPIIHRFLLEDRQLDRDFIVVVVDDFRARRQ